VWFMLAEFNTLTFTKAFATWVFSGKGWSVASVLPIFLLDYDIALTMNINQNSSCVSFKKLIINRYQFSNNYFKVF
jgi:hypothetical protein